MASKTVVLLEDDLDGGKADETVNFAIDGVEYAIDLSAENATKLRGAVEGYVTRARRVGGRRQPARPTKSDVRADTKAVRAWAASRGIELSKRGRVPAAVLEQYHAAGN